MMNNCFGIALDLKLRCVDWSFDLSQVKANVYMQHSQDDDNVPFRTAEITAQMLPNCRLEIGKIGGHFSDELLDGFIEKTMVAQYKSGHV